MVTFKAEVITDPRDSIDGLGFTIQDLKPELHTVAYFRRVEAQLTPEQRAAIGESARIAKTKLDESQRRLLEAITTTATKERNP